MKERYKIALTLLISILIVFLVLSCSTVQGIERRAEVAQAKHTAQLQRISNDTIPSQNININSWGNGFFNPYYNNRFFNSGWYNRGVYNTPIIITKRKRYVNRRNSNSRVIRSNRIPNNKVYKKRVLRKVQVRPVRKIKQ